MEKPITTTSQAILGLLSLRSWSTYELTKLGRKQLASEQSKWDAFARAMGLLLKPLEDDGR